MHQQATAQVATWPDSPHP